MGLGGQQVCHRRRVLPQAVSCDSQAWWHVLLCSWVPAISLPRRVNLESWSVLTPSASAKVPLGELPLIQKELKCFPSTKFGLRCGQCRGRRKGKKDRTGGLAGASGARTPRFCPASAPTAGEAGRVGKSTEVTHSFPRTCALSPARSPELLPHKPFRALPGLSALEALVTQRCSEGMKPLSQM